MYSALVGSGRIEFRCGACRVLVLAATTLAAGLLISGCDLPRDPQNTLNRVRRGTLRVGVMHDQPWAVVGDGCDRDPDGIEVALARLLAQDLNAEIRWKTGGESELMDSLQHYQLDLVIGGILESSAWKHRVAFTQPYATTDAKRPGEKLERRRRHVLALPPGENGWLVYVEGFLNRRRETVSRIVTLPPPQADAPGTQP